MLYTTFTINTSDFYYVYFILVNGIEIPIYNTKTYTITFITEFKNEYDFISFIS